MKRRLLVLLAAAACAAPARSMPTDTLARYRDEDAELGRLYEKVVAQLKKANPPAVKSLRAAERKWIAFRDAECRFHEETLLVAGIPTAACLEELTLQRIATLKNVSEALEVESR